MSKGSPNKFLPIYFTVLGLGAAGLGYMAYSASDDASTEEAAYKKALNELDALEKAPISRTEENAKEKTVRVDKYLAQVADLNSTLRKFQASPTDTPDPQAFQKKLQKHISDINKAAKEHDVTLPAKFDLGMGEYLNGFAKDAKSAQALSAHLEGLSFIANAAINAGVRSIDSLSRDEIAAEREAEAAPDPANKKPPVKPKPAPGAAKEKPTVPSLLDESKVLERQPVRITVTGKHQSVTAFLEALANTSPETAPHFVTIRALNIENEAKTGSPKTLEVTPQEIKIEGQAPYILDAKYILGNQAVKAYLDMDIIRFLDEDSTAKTDSKPVAPKPAEGANK